MPEPEIKIFLKIYFNDNANPYGDFDPQMEKTVPLEEVVGDPADLHEAMRNDETIGGYETYETRSVTIDGHTYKTDDINPSIKTYFGSVKPASELRIYNGLDENGQELWVPFFEVYPNADPNGAHFFSDGGGINLHLDDKSNIRVIDRKTDNQVWPAISPS